MTSDDESEVSQKSVGTEKVICSGCKATAVRKVVICDNCKSTQHKSCHEKYGCCNKKKEQIQVNEITFDTEVLLKENVELKKIVSELEGKLEDLKESNLKLQTEKQELQQMVSNFEPPKYVSYDLFNTKMMELSTEMDKIKRKILTNGKVDSQMPLFSEVANKIQTHIPTADKKQDGTNNKILTKPSTTNKIENKQRKIMDTIINLNNDKDNNVTDPNKISDNSSVQYNKWQKVEHKQKKSRSINTIVGKSKEYSTVKTIPKFIHLHVYRLSPDTTEDNLRTLLLNKFPEVMCEKMLSKHPKVYSSFKVSVYETHHDLIMNPEVWPTGACVNRFLYLRQKSTTTIQ